MTGSSVKPVVYYGVFATLVLLTVLTLWISFVDLGAWHTVIGLSIAGSKAALVALFFMHLISSNRLTWLVVGGSVLWFGILLCLTLSDYLTRGWAL